MKLFIFSGDNVLSTYYDGWVVIAAPSYERALEIAKYNFPFGYTGNGGWLRPKVYVINGDTEEGVEEFEWGHE